MTRNDTFNTPQRKAFIAYCRDKVPGKTWLERDFSSEIKTDSAAYHYYVPCGSHGNFILQIDVMDFKYNDKIFALGFQYQKGTCKLNCLRPGSFYNQSEKAEIVNFISIFEKNRYMYTRCNWPQSRAYISLSRREPSLIELPCEEFAEKLFKEFKSAIEVIEKLKIEFEKIGCQFF